ncbi:MAG: alpha/beta fold hydrolase [Proteobacteria bacterium]|nr:alpha/beta fold hydrolase [Pseudomonadota bacterium]
MRSSILKKSTWFSGFGRLARHGFITILAFVIGGCGLSPRTENPIPTISSPTDERKGKSLIVMLPGRGDRAESFRTAGFLDTAADHAFDVIAVDAHLGYYKERNLIPRLHNDVILSAKKDGYEKIWLLGISMGGFGSLLYAEQHPGLVDGIILLAPYLGDPGLASEIVASGGLASWSGEESQFMEHEVAIWQWLKNSRNESDHVPILLGYGLSDRFAGNYGPLQDEIEGLTIYTEDGGHKWTTWSNLWTRILSDISQREK